MIAWPDRGGTQLILRGAALGTAGLIWASSSCQAQSGQASLHGWVAFEGVAYVDTQPRARVVLRKDGADSTVVDSATTDEHGFFDFARTGLGRFKLEITADGFQAYEADVYLSSDFAGNWAVQLRAGSLKHP